jgi:hypothetical protein
MMLCKVISSVAAAFTTPVYVELALVDAVANPIEGHVYGIGSLLFDSIIGDTGSCNVVHCHGCGKLWMTHFG